MNLFIAVKGILVLVIISAVRVCMRLFFGSAISTGIRAAVTGYGKLLLGGSAISMVSMRGAVSVLVRTFFMAVLRLLFVTAKNEARRYR